MQSAPESTTPKWPDRTRLDPFKPEDFSDKTEGIEIPAWAGMLLIVSPIIFWSLLRLVKRIRKARNGT